MLAMCFAFGLASCANESSSEIQGSSTQPPSAGSTSGSNVDVATTVDSQQSEASEEPQESNVDEGSQEGGTGSDPECIEGDWVVSSEELAKYYSAVGQATGVPMSGTGSARIRFIDFQFVYDAQFELEMDVDGQVAMAKADGTVTGSYVIDGGIMSTETGANNLDIMVKVGGFEIDAGEFGNELLSSFPINDAPFSCDGPTIYFQTGGPDLHPVTLKPYDG